MEPVFFTSPTEFRAWLEKNHGREPELLVGFYKKGSGKPSLTWPQSVDEALCFGWIDGVRRSLGPDAYTIRFTPRRPTSVWSAVNVARVEALTDEGRMRPAGSRAFAARREDKTGVYAFERRAAAVLTADEDKRFRDDRAAAAYFDARPPWYRRTAMHWVVSAKRPETRARRLATLIADSAAGRTLRQLTRPGAASPDPPAAEHKPARRATKQRPTRAAPAGPRKAKGARAAAPRT